MKGCRALEASEIAVLTKSFTCTRDKALFVLGIRTGFRISELLSLRIRDVWQYGRVTDYVTVTRRYMKGHESGRTLPLHPDAQAALKPWIVELIARGHGQAETFLFRSRQGGNRAIGRIQAHYIFRAAFEANEMTGPLGTHAMRKTFARRVYEQLNHDLLETAQVLGHANVSTTVRYLAADQRRCDAAVLSMW